MKEQKNLPSCSGRTAVQMPVEFVFLYVPKAANHFERKCFILCLFDLHPTKGACDTVVLSGSVIGNEFNEHRFSDHFYPIHVRSIIIFQPFHLQNVPYQTKD